MLNVMLALDLDVIYLATALGDRTRPIDRYIDYFGGVTRRIEPDWLRHGGTPDGNGNR